MNHKNGWKWKWYKEIDKNKSEKKIRNVWWQSGKRDRKWDMFGEDEKEEEKKW